MCFLWNETKRKSNLVKHQLDFVDAEKVIAGLTFTFEDDRFEYGEPRFITMGLLQDMVVVIAHTDKEG
jgi:uncharacterized DUF497 family protein